MIKLYLVAEFEEAETVEEAQSQLDAFREACQPAYEFGIRIYRAPDNS